MRDEIATITQVLAKTDALLQEISRNYQEEAKHREKAEK